MQADRSILAYSIILTNACFLGCSHCFLKNTKNKQKAMEVETVKKFIDRAMETSGELTFNWGGGDPLILGKKYMKDIVSLKCFTDKNTRNTLYSTFLIDFDAEWKEILNSFDSLMFSLDSYRIKEKGFNINKVMFNLVNLNVPMNVSYTPSKEDNEDTIERFYSIAQDIGAEVFHIGFLYDDIELIPPDVYNRAIDKVFSLQTKYGKPVCGFTPVKDNIYHSVGWRAYDCFTKCRYVCDGEITSCYILKSKGFDVPSIKIDDFIEGRADIVSMNDSYISSFFLSGRTNECYECEHFPLCMGGCPYFVHRSSNINIDAYCSVYKKIIAANLETTV